MQCMFVTPYNVVLIPQMSAIVCCCYSDEDDGDTLDWLPMAPEIEDPEEPGWGQLEVKKLSPTCMYDRSKYYLLIV